MSAVFAVLGILCSAVCFCLGYLLGDRTCRKFWQRFLELEEEIRWLDDQLRELERLTEK